ncbi:restriction endonuclease subunit S [Ralstonia pseudosolanacearum]|uniref:restriction endonuclease subunit S n=1 Tax=Ralstonia pseudosolanacearum TaxID=1310165 RepID=UPI00339A1185
MSQIWKTELLGSVATLQRGFDLPNRLRKQGPVPIVTSSGIEATHSEAKVKAPGVVTGRYGTIGQVYFVDTDFWPLNTTLYVRDFHENDPLFVSYLLKTIDFDTHSGKSGVPGVNRNDLHEITVAVPPTKAEQQAIAKALNDADVLIDALERLLTKKRQIKQGAMQELLTGRKRLPGFTGEWKTSPLGNIGEFLKGSGITRGEAQSGALPCVRYGEIYTAHNNYIRTFHSWISAEVTASATRIQPGDLLFTGSGETKEEIGKCVAFVDDREAYAGGDIVILRPRDADSLFLGYALNTTEINRQKASRGQGDAVVHISASALARITVPIPGLNEQTAIATLLSDVDAEISELEAKLTKAHGVKQGMMQQLLTGKIRLI